MKYILLILVLVLTGDLVHGESADKSSSWRLQTRLIHQEVLIGRDLKAGKLTKDQAKSLKAQLESIRQQEIADLKENGTKTLTSEQLADLNKKLDELSKSIPLK